MNKEWAYKYITFINKLLKYWFIWVIFVLIVYVLHYVELPNYLKAITEGADLLWTALHRIRYFPGVLGLLYLLCKYVVNKDAEV